MESLKNENLIKLIFEGFTFNSYKEYFAKVQNKTISYIILRFLSHEHFYKTIGNIKTIIDNHKNVINSLTIYDDNTILSVSNNTTFKLFNATNFLCIESFEESDASPVLSVVKLPNGNIAYSTTVSLKFLDKSFKCIKFHYYLQGFNNLHIFQKQKLAYTSRNQNHANIYYIGLIDYVNFRFHGNSEVQYGAITCLVNLDKDRLASGGENWSIKLWNNGHSLTCSGYLNGHGAAILALAFNYKYSLLISSSVDKTIKVWDVNSCENFECLKTIQGLEYMAMCLLSLSDIYFAASIGDKIKIYNLTNYKGVNILEGHSHVIHKLIMFKDNRIMSASLKEEITIWDC
jgi:WD40 repeat protein